MVAAQTVVQDGLRGDRPPRLPAVQGGDRGGCVRGRNVRNGRRTVARAAGDLAGVGRPRPLERPEGWDRGGEGGAHRAGRAAPGSAIDSRKTLTFRCGGRPPKGAAAGPCGSPGPAQGVRRVRSVRRADRGAGSGSLAARGSPRRTGLGWGSGADRLARAVDGRVLRGPLAARTRWGGSARAGFPPRSAGACRRGPGGLSSVGGRGQAPTANSTTWAASAICACSSTLRAMLSRTSSVQGHRPAQIARRSSPDLPITSGVKSRPL